MMFVRELRYCTVLFMLLAVCNFACAQDEITYKIKERYDRMFYNSNNPQIEVAVTNNSSYEGFNEEIVCKVETYAGESVYEFSQLFYIGPDDSVVLNFSFRVNPGFYRVILEKEGKIIEQAVMGYEPELLGKAGCNPHVKNGIFSAGESKSADSELVKQKWQQSLDRLGIVPMNAVVSKVKKSGGKLRNAYKVTLRSVGNVVIEGYYVTPKSSGVYPVVITCLDKDEQLWIPDGNSNEDRVDFVIKPRNEGFRNEEFYFNRYMDVVRAIDFASQRKEVDLKNIFLNGRGVGAALAMGAALDSRVTAVTAYAPAMLNENVLGVTRIYDIENLSGMIKCPLLMGVGLEDTICAPHVSFKIYNLIESVKEYYIFVEGHDQPALWRELSDNFYSKHGL